MYGKMENGAFVYAPKQLKIGNRVHYNPSDEMYRNKGYKPVVDTPCPEAAEGEEPKFYIATYEEQEDSIVKVWVEAEPAEHEPSEIDRLYGRIAELEQSDIEQGQYITDLELASIEQGQYITDLELKILGGGENV